MQFKDFKEGIRLSRLGMGVMRLPAEDAEGTRILYDKAKALIDHCMAEGINYYDTAYIYHGGNSEAFLGKALAEYPRDSYYVADKYNFQAEPDYRKQFQEQLERLGMERIDFYLLHGIQDHFIKDLTENGSIAFFDEKKKEGKIRYLGFSFHGSAKALRHLLTIYPWDFVQIQLNYYDWYHGDAKELYEILAQADIPVMVMEPVHGGLLARLNEESAKELKGTDTEASLASYAMRWVMELPKVQVVLSGMSEESQVEDNLRTFSEGRALSENEHGRIQKAAELLYRFMTVACTECRYCTPNCPEELDIPYLLKKYNEAKTGGSWHLRELKDLPREKQPSACIGCGACQKHCPQSFSIPEYMKELQKMMEN